MTCGIFLTLNNLSLKNNSYGLFFSCCLKKHVWPQKFHPNKTLPHDVISTFFPFLRSDISESRSSLHLLHDNGVNLKKYKILEGEILSPSGSPLSCGGLKPERAFPQLPAVLFVWTATGHKSGRHCPPLRRSNSDRGSGLRWNAFERGEKNIRLKANVKIKMGGSRSRSARRNSIQISSSYPVLLFFSVSCVKAVEAWFWFSEQSIFFICVTIINLISFWESLFWGRSNVLRTPWPALGLQYDDFTILHIYRLRDS